MPWPLCCRTGDARWIAVACRTVRGRSPDGAGCPRLGRGRLLGDRGERLVERYLRRQGMTIVGRQVRVGGGELDLVAVERRTIVFVEVKTRRSDVAGHPLEAVIGAEAAASDPRRVGLFAPPRPVGICGPF